MVDLKLPKKRTILNPAPAWKRIIAFIIDILIIQFIISISPLSGIIQNTLPLSKDFAQNYSYISSHPELIGQISGVISAVFGLIFIYSLIFEFKLGQTPGRMIMKLYLVHADKKEKISFLNLILRSIVFIPIFSFNPLWIIDPLYMVFSGKRLSDIFSKTMIVEEITL